MLLSSEEARTCATVLLGTFVRGMTQLRYISTQPRRARGVLVCPVACCGPNILTEHKLATSYSS